MHLRPSAAYLALAVAFLLAAFACGATSSPSATARRQALDLCNFTIALKPPCTSATGGRLAKEDPFYALMATLARLSNCTTLTDTPEEAIARVCP